MTPPCRTRATAVRKHATRCGIRHCPAFAAFYRAINGRDPFPWQSPAGGIRRERDERWPTGRSEYRPDLARRRVLTSRYGGLRLNRTVTPGLRTAPTRIWWVVNRRLLVDSTAEHAKAKSRGALGDPVVDVGSDAAGARRRSNMHRRASPFAVDRSRPRPPLDVISLRGGIASRKPHGSGPSDRGSVHCCRCTARACCFGDTVPIGHQSTLPWPARTALSYAGRSTPCGTSAGAGSCSRRLQSRRRRDTLGAKRSRPTVVSLTATGDCQRREHGSIWTTTTRRTPVVRQRLDATKPVQSEVLVNGRARRNGSRKRPSPSFAEAPAPAACLVFANTPKSARETFEHLVASALPEVGGAASDGTRTRTRSGANSRPDTGSRAWDGDGAPPRMRTASTAPRRGGHPDPGSRAPTSTRNILVTEGCGVRALTQRLGRLNRLGRFSHCSRRHTFMCLRRSRRGGEQLQHEGEDAWPVYGPEPATVLERLRNSACWKTRIGSRRPVPAFRWLRCWGSR